jgi:aldehyde:ferredoxin oxidoreductase
MHFYTGRVLRVDLGRLRAQAESLDPDRARLDLGGKGLLFRYLFDEPAQALDEYYDLRGWDDQGVPSEETLSTLGVDVRI